MIKIPAKFKEIATKHAMKLIKDPNFLYTFSIIMGKHGQDSDELRIFIENKIKEYEKESDNN